MDDAQTSDTTARPFIISRVFDAPRDSVFNAWTEADRLKQWFGPKGVTMSSCTLDLRPGGVFHYCMRVPGGGDMWGRWVFREIVAPERIVVVASFSDAQGNVTRAPFSADWPLESISTTTFLEEAGRTTVTVESLPINASGKERKMFNDMQASMQQGWSGTFDQLAAYLAVTGQPQTQ